MNMVYSGLEEQNDNGRVKTSIPYWQKELTTMIARPYVSLWYPLQSLSPLQIKTGPSASGSKGARNCIFSNGFGRRMCIYRNRPFQGTKSYPSVRLKTLQVKMAPATFGIAGQKSMQLKVLSSAGIKWK